MNGHDASAAPDLDGCFRCSFGHFYFDCIVNNKRMPQHQRQLLSPLPPSPQSPHRRMPPPEKEREINNKKAAKSREEKAKERERKREEQMWRRHQMELQLKQRGIAVSPCGRWIKHNIKCGEGAYKRVYRGYDREQGRPIAWCESSSFTWARISQLREEQGSQGGGNDDQVRAPNIVRYYDLLDCYFELDENGEKGEKVKATVIVTEFMSEGTLREKMKTFYNERTREAVVDFNVFQSWMQQILEGLRICITSEYAF
uniref:Protein kinase domain-containing protein n=1 Tax=Macrostomum lignano TaxID=282301 RepID=A0A1I8FI02_9PLAT